MEADKSKVQQHANLLASRGQYDKAIAEWNKLVVDAPSDGTIHNNIGDLHLKRNARSEAIDSYFQAGAAFQAAGSALKAIAVYKKILKIDPNNYKVYQHLGDLNAERGLVTNAVSDYVTLSKLYLKAGLARDALAVYRKIVNLDPGNLDAKRRLAELCVQENLKEEAIKTFLQLGKECSAQKRPQEAHEAYLAVLRLDPENTRAQRLLNHPQEALHDEPPGRSGSFVGQTDADRQHALEAAARQIDAGRYEQADSLLSELLSAHPGDPEVCRLLAMLHLKRGELTVASSEIQFLAEAAIRAQDFALAESMLEEYLKVDPNSVTLLELSGHLHEQKGETEAAVAQYAKAVEVLLERPDPEMPGRAAEVYHKITTLAPGSPWASRLAAAFAPAQQTADEPPGAVEPPLRLLDEPSQPTHGIEPETPPVESDAPSGQPTEQHYKTRYDLGMAYKNMGLLDEAIEEFRLAVHGSEHFGDASIMLASCLKEKGSIDRAIECLEQALADHRCEGEKGTSIRYELGMLYEAACRWEEAEKTFSAIPTFLDVPMRLAHIQEARQSSSASNPSLMTADDAGNHHASVATEKTQAPERKKRRISYL